MCLHRTPSVIVPFAFNISHCTFPSILSWFSDLYAQPHPCCHNSLLNWYFKWHNFPNHFIYPKRPHTSLLHLMVQVKSDNNFESPPFLCPNSLNNQVLLVLSHFSSVMVQMLKGPLRFLCLNPWSPTEVAAWEAVQSLRCRAWLVKVSHLGQAFEGVQLGLLLNWALSTSWSASVRSPPWKPPPAPQLSYLPTFEPK